MKVKGLLIATVIVAAAMAGLGLWVAAGLPAGAELPTHWNAAGEVDDTRPALQALLFAPGLTLLFGLVFAAIPLLEPLQDKLKASAPVLRVAWIGLLGVMTATQLMVAGPALGWNLGVSFLFIVIGLMFIALGNVLPKSRPGFFVGIRTPWTIMDTDNWIAANRLGGKLLMLAGLAMIVSALLPISDPTRFTVLLVAVLAAALVPTAYSWWLWRKRHADAAKQGTRK